MMHAAPVSETDRIDGVDAARGLALLGIFCVNIQLFAEPFGRMMAPPTGLGTADTIAHYFVHTFCTGKFYGLFSLLFGIGFALQRGGATARGASFTGIYARRLLFLGGLGALHALLVWYGDILFIYAMCAVVLLLCAKVPPRAKVIVAAALFALYAMIGAPMAMMQRPQGTQAASQASVEEPAPASPNMVNEPGPVAPGAESSQSPAVSRKGAFWSTPFGRLIDGFKTQRITDPTSAEWQDLERGVYQEGPYGQLFLFRGFTWITMLIWCIFGFYLTVVALFFIGSALAETGRLGKDAAPLHRRLLAIGLLVGLPLSAFGAYATGVRYESAAWRGLGTGAMILGAPLMSLGYLSAVLLVMNAARGGLLGRALASTGRMALTNYLTQSLIATSVFYYYGLGWFGSVGRARQLLLVAVVFTLQVVFSVLWMRAFRYGPMEWLWRMVTYLKAPAMRRRGTGAGD